MTDNVLESLALEEAKFVRCAGGRDRHFFSVGEAEAGLCPCSMLEICGLEDWGGFRSQFAEFAFPEVA